MIRFCPAFVVLLFPLALWAEDNKPVIFSTREGKFSVTVPEKPTEKTNKIKTAAGEIDAYLFVIDMKDRAYIVTYNDYKPGTVDKDSDKVLAGVIKGNADSLKGKVVSEEKITIGKKKHPGREIRIEFGEKQIYRARVFLVGDRLYQVVALGPDEFTKSKPVEEYFKSFAIDG